MNQILLELVNQRESLFCMFLVLVWVEISGKLAGIIFLTLEENTKKCCKKCVIVYCAVVCSQIFYRSFHIFSVKGNEVDKEMNIDYSTAYQL